MLMLADVRVGVSAWRNHDDQNSIETKREKKEKRSKLNSSTAEDEEDDEEDALIIFEGETVDPSSYTLS